MTSSASAIDVLIPAYNAAATLRESLESIRMQSEVKLRIIVVDDGSTDQTPQILNELAKKDSRIIVARQSNGGIVKALNLGLSYVQAPLVARHDSDDLAAQHRLARQVDYLRDHPDCVAVSSFARHINADGTAMASTARFRPVEQADPFALPSWEPYLLHPFLLARKWALDRVGGYRHVKHAEDTDLYWRLQQVGRLHVLPEVLGSYRLSPQSVSSKSIHNGRVLALFSQLAALSARRRAAGRTDLAFDPAWVEDVSILTSPADLLERASEPLDNEEVAYLSAAFAAKLLELTSYRPFELETADCRVIREALRRPLHLSRLNKRQLARARAIAVSRLAAAGRISDAALLCNIEVASQAALRYALNRGLALLGPRKSAVLARSNDVRSPTSAEVLTEPSANSKH